MYPFNNLFCIMCVCICRANLKLKTTSANAAKQFQVTYTVRPFEPQSIQQVITREDKHTDFEHTVTEQIRTYVHYLALKASAAQPVAHLVVDRQSELVIHLRN